MARTTVLYARVDFCVHENGKSTPTTWEKVRLAFDAVEGIWPYTIDGAHDNGAEEKSVQPLSGEEVRKRGADILKEHTERQFPQAKITNFNVKWLWL